MSYDNTNRGAAFMNDKKGNDNAPEFKGSLNVDGTDYWFSMWLNKQGENGKNPGERYVSYSIQKKEQRGNQSFDAPSEP